MGGISVGGRKKVVVAAVDRAIVAVEPLQRLEIALPDLLDHQLIFGRRFHRHNGDDPGTVLPAGCHGPAERFDHPVLFLGFLHSFGRAFVVAGKSAPADEHVVYRNLYEIGRGPGLHAEHFQWRAPIDPGGGEEAALGFVEVRSGTGREVDEATARQRALPPSTCPACLSAILSSLVPATSATATHVNLLENFRLSIMAHSIRCREGQLHCLAVTFPTSIQPAARREIPDSSSRI